MDLRHKAILENPNIPWTTEGIDAWWERADKKFRTAVKKRVEKLERKQEELSQSPKAKRRRLARYKNMLKLQKFQKG